jgi:two-component system, NtrC family, response regulator AlgB
LLKSAEQAAASVGAILLIGESGAGKSVLAKQIHLWSNRRAKSFSIIDCTRLAQQNQEGSEWRLDRLPIGAMRGAERLEAAQGGTLFLANIDDLPLRLQVEFARFVQNRTLETPEGEKVIDVRIIAASASDLVSEVRTHRFSEDLFYGLNIISLRMPPLRERSMDILPMATRMLAAAAFRNHRGDLHLSPEAAAAVTRYSWPGNLRELRNAMEAAAILCESGKITLANLPEAVSKHVPGIIPPAPSKASLHDMELQHILRVLAQSPSLEQAAATLGIHATTLWRKRKRYKLDVTIGSKSGKASR